MQGTTPTANSIEEAAQYVLLEEDDGRLTGICWSTWGRHIMTLQALWNEVSLGYGTEYYFISRFLTNMQQVRLCGMQQNSMGCSGDASGAVWDAPEHGNGDVVFADGTEVDRPTWSLSTQNRYSTTMLESPVRKRRRPEEHSSPQQADLDEWLNYQQCVMSVYENSQETTEHGVDETLFEAGS